MSLPREVLPNRYYMITRRCTQRHYLLRPGTKINQAFEYCLGYAAEKHKIDIVLTCAMSNHHHTVIYDRLGTYPQFLEYFHMLLARCLNALRDRKENFWSSDPPCMVRLVGMRDILDKLAYVACNPVTANLVETVEEWPGVNRYQALISQQPVTVERPKFFFRQDDKSKMPKSVTIRYAFPPEAGEAQLYLAALRKRVTERVRELREERRREGRRVVGAEAVRRLSWRDKPKTKRKKTDIRPTFAARDTWDRQEAVTRNKEFLRAYKEARAAFLAGEDAAFPLGTYWLRRFVGVPIKQPDADPAEPSPPSTRVPQSRD